MGVSVMTALEFWFDFASTYSYLSAERIERLAAERGVHVRWRPFPLGPIFQAQGWSTSPFNLYPAKGRYMVADMTRICAARGLAFAMPAVFPAAGLRAARMALAIGDEGRRAAFSRAVFAAEFGEGADIADESVLQAVAAQVGLDGDALLALSGTEVVKLALRRETETAQALGVFGAPSFVTSEGELFWGDDRLEMALGWQSITGRE
jgi:2-hydroxychromene-2-carboxylate isomerase